MSTSLFRALFGTLLGLAFLSAVAAAEDKPAEQPATPTEQSAPQSAPDQPAPGAQAQTQSEDDKIVCKKEPPPVGSRMGGKKVCRTVADWRRIQSGAREVTQEAQDRNVPPPTN